MAITSYSTYRSRRDNPQQSASAQKASAAAPPQARLLSWWTEATLAGAAPGAAAVPTNATVGALGQTNGTALRVLRATIEQAANNAVGANATMTRLILADRLSHQSGLSGTAAGAQTTNLPTAALTRYATGVGVFASIDVYTLIGAVAQTYTCSYTNEAGTAGRTSPAAAIGGTNFREVTRSLVMPLQAGDYGVRAVASLTLAGSTGTVGDMGVTLWKPLLSFTPLDTTQTIVDAVINLGGNCPQVLSNACLYWLVMQSSVITGSAQGGMFIDLAINED